MGRHPVYLLWVDIQILVTYGLTRSIRLQRTIHEFFIAFAGLDLFAIVLNQLTNLYHFAYTRSLCHPWSLSKYSNSLPRRHHCSILLSSISSQGPLCQNSSSLLCLNSKSLPLRNPCFANPHLFAGTAFFFSSSHLPNPWSLYNLLSSQEPISSQSLISSQFITSSQPFISLISLISLQEPLFFTSSQEHFRQQSSLRLPALFFPRYVS